MAPSEVRTVAHLIAPAAAGGAESVVLALSASARERSRVIVLNQVVGSSEPPHSFSEQLRKRNVRSHEVRCGRRRYAAEVRAVAELIRRENVDVLHAHGYHSTVVGYFAGRRAGIPIVATVHGYLSRNLKERFYNVVDRLLLRRFDAVIAVSQGIARQLVASGLRADRVMVVQNGLGAPNQAPDRLSARQSLGLDRLEQVVGWVGRLSPEKGADLFLQALSKSADSFRAVVIGDGSELQHLEQLARDLNVENRVQFAGFRADAAELLGAFDVLALSSRTEGTPMIILEAVSAGVPIVAFQTGGIPDLLDVDSAWLVAPLDVTAFGQALRESLASPGERSRRAESARARLGDRLSAENWLERVWRVYDHATRVAGRM